MKKGLKYYAWVGAVALGLGIGGGTLQAVAAPFFQDQQPQQPLQVLLSVVAPARKLAGHLAASVSVAIGNSESLTPRCRP